MISGSILFFPFSLLRRFSPFRSYRARTVPCLSGGLKAPAKPINQRARKGERETPSGVSHPSINQPRRITRDFNRCNQIPVPSIAPLREPSEKPTERLDLT